MVEQNQVARDHGLPFLRTPDDIRRALVDGDLVPLSGGSYEVSGNVSYPYVVPPVRSFVDWLSSGYLDACGEKLVVTSAVRALSQQPRNASALSVHPAGMAVDLRVSKVTACRQWLESTLLELKALGVANGIRESSPAHYHVAVYPGPYLTFAADRLAKERTEQAERAAARPVLPALRAAARDRAEAFAAGVSARAPEGDASDAPQAAAVLSFSLTAMMGAVGGWLVFGSQLPGMGGWLPRARRRFAHRGR
jgi:hypothetical protein